MKDRTRAWVYIAAIWGCVGLVQATQTVFDMRLAGMHHAWLKLFLMQVIAWLPWALATPLVIRLGRKFPLDRLANAFLHLAVAAVIAALSAFWETSLEAQLSPWAPDATPGPFLATWLNKSYSGYLISLVVYALIITLNSLLDSRQKLSRQQTETARLNEQLSIAQLNALRRQIEPHFIFNALNCIAGMVREHQNAGAVDMIAALSDVLRRLTRESSEAQTSLAQELEFAEKYFQICKMRFAERLNVVLEIPDRLRAAQVPSLILQPLIENAVKHGIAQLAQGGTVQVAAHCEHDTLNLSVYNDGPPLDENWQCGPGVGLSNMRARLQLMFGANAALSLTSAGGGGVNVAVTLPYREA
jgi:two-component system LytT family sensor kinase